jgi:hypothetical protein
MWKDRKHFQPQSVRLKDGKCIRKEIMTLELSGDLLRNTFVCIAVYRFSSYFRENTSNIERFIKSADI